MKEQIKEPEDLEIDLDTLSPSQIKNLLQLGEIDAVIAHELLNAQSSQRSLKNIGWIGWLQLLMILIMSPLILTIVGLYLIKSYLFSK